MDPNFTDFGLAGIVLYLLVKDVLPLIVQGTNRLVDIIVPSKLRKEEERERTVLEHEARRIDLREREVIAMEQVGKSLAIMDNRLQRMEVDHDLLSQGLARANQALSIVLDRVDRAATQQVRTISHKENE